MLQIPPDRRCSRDGWWASLSISDPREELERILRTIGIPSLPLSSWGRSKISSTTEINQILNGDSLELKNTVGNRKVSVNQFQSPTGGRTAITRTSLLSLPSSRADQHISCCSCSCFRIHYLPIDLLSFFSFSYQQTPGEKERVEIQFIYRRTFVSPSLPMSMIVNTGKSYFPCWSSSEWPSGS